MKTLTTTEILGPSFVVQARDLLAKAKTIDYAKQVRDQAKAIAAYATDRGASDESIAYATEAKLWAERRIGELSKALPKATKDEAGAAGGRGKKAGNKPLPALAPKASALAEHGISKMQASRWEKLADVPEPEFQRIAADAGRRKSKPAHVSANSGVQEWYTPPSILGVARAVMGGIDLDPASCLAANKNVKAKRFYSEKDNGLANKWAGRVWMNPPYANKLVMAFSEKLVRELGAGVKEACVLVNNATETAWGQMLLRYASCVCLIEGRVKFLDVAGEPSAAPLQGQMLLYFGPGWRKFHEAASSIGVVYGRMS